LKTKELAAELPFNNGKDPTLNSEWFTEISWIFLGYPFKQWVIDPFINHLQYFNGICTKHLQYLICLVVDLPL
jgi:hypothetical protein